MCRNPFGSGGKRVRYPATPRPRGQPDRGSLAGRGQQPNEARHAAGCARARGAKPTRAGGWGVARTAPELGEVGLEHLGRVLREVALR